MRLAGNTMLFIRISMSWHAIFVLSIEPGVFTTMILSSMQMEKMFVVAKFQEMNKSEAPESKKITVDMLFIGNIQRTTSGDSQASSTEMW